MGDVLQAVVLGGKLAAGYNPLLAVIGAAVCAVLLAVGSGRWGANGGRGKRTVRIPRSRLTLALGVLVGVWFLGDGAMVTLAGIDLARGAQGLAGAAAGSGDWIALAIWGLGSLALGYVLPAWAGAFAGRRVTHGTGWLTAMSLAVAVSLAISVIVSRLVG